MYTLHISGFNVLTGTQPRKPRASMYLYKSQAITDTTVSIESSNKPTALEID